MSNFSIIFMKSERYILSKALLKSMVIKQSSLVTAIFRILSELDAPIR